MKYTQNYLNDILIRMAYHSSAIEGNTITLPEVSNIFLERFLPKYKTIREFYKIENHINHLYNYTKIKKYEKTSFFQNNDKSIFYTFSVDFNLYFIYFHKRRYE